jgi:antidote-toxin recognition MazE-like antitoxin
MKPQKVSERMRGYRARKQASGLRLIQLWVPDTRSKRFAAECRRQCRLLQGDPAEADALEFIERAGAWDDAPR